MTIWQIISAGIILDILKGVARGERRLIFVILSPSVILSEAKNLKKDKDKILKSNKYYG